MKKYLFIILLLLLSTYSFAQRNFTEGIIITKENDSIRGYINFGTDQQNSIECKFKKSLDAKEEIYSPSDIKGYVLSEIGKYYISYEISIENITKAVFLEYLVKGVIDLYSYVDLDGQIYYIFEEDTQKPLIVTKRKAILTESGRIKEDERYKYVLKYSFGDYSSSANDIQKAHFDQKTMIGVAREYHDAVCTTGEECIVFENKNPDKSYIQAKFSIYGGAKYLNFKINERYFPNYQESIDKIVPTIGTQLLISSPRWNKNLGILADISFSYFEFDHEEQSNYYVEQLKYNTIYTTVAVGFKYTQMNNKLKPSFEIGVPVSVFFSKKAEANRYLISDPSRTSQKKFEICDYSYGIYAAVGIKYPIAKKHDLLLNLGYEYNQVMSSPNISHKLKGAFIKAGFAF